MSDFQEQLSSVQTKLDSVREQLERHENVVEGIANNPGDYDADAVETYLADLEQGLEGADFLDSAEASLEPLEEATEAAAEAFLENAKVLVDDHEIEGVEVQYLKEDDMEASILVESPKVNQLRGGRTLLELPDGRAFDFTIQQTLIAEVTEDKSGYLELILGLREA